jgi:hypothetical protein
MIPIPLPPAQLLHELQQRITTEIKDAWLFPQRRAVGGFLGTGPIVIVGWRPSHSPFPDEGANRLFYDILTEYGLENAHLTNVIKSRGRKGDPDPEDLPVHEEIFWRELEITSAPYAVAPMGNEYYDRIAALLLARGVKPIARLPQYASMNYGPDQVAAFRRAIADLAAVARRYKWIP